jgi:hypothetical protein
MLFRHNITDYEHMRIASLFVLCLKELSHVIPIDWVAPPPAAPPVVVWWWWWWEMMLASASSWPKMRRLCGTRIAVALVNCQRFQTRTSSSSLPTMSSSRLSSTSNAIVKFKTEDHDQKPAKVASMSCNCKKSKCLKLYCECFAANRLCDGCSCKDCGNNT